MKADVKREMKELVGVSHKFLQGYFLKTWITGLHFSLHLSWHSAQFDIFC